MMQKITTEVKSFSKQCMRVWHLLRKPSKEEVKTISKVSAIGILVIGFVGFLISMLLNFL